MKRIRNDGQISRQEYDDDYETSVQQPGNFSRATPNTLATRKFLSAQRGDKKVEFAKHIKALNSSFYKWFKAEVATDATSDLTSGVQDYIDYIAQLEGRYLRTYGEVLTFGSGDCGQLAHGMDEDNDLMVKFPRIVYSLRDKKVCGIACGGLHNAVWTEMGHVYTWGSSDTGALGRGGDEAMPLLVTGLVDADETIIGVACGDAQTICVSTRGNVWGWGCYIDKEGKKFFNPSKSAANQVKDIKKMQTDPMIIQGISDVVEVACGSAFNIALTEDGSVYSWGLGECGELARQNPPLKKKAIGGEEAQYDLEGMLKHHITPSLMLRYKDDSCTDTVPVRDVKAIGCGAYHSLIVCLKDQNNGLEGLGGMGGGGGGGGGNTVLAAGLNNYAQLGLGKGSSSDNRGDTESRSFLTRIHALEGLGVISVKGGVHHSLVLTSSGEILAFGRGDSGQLGIPIRGGEGGLDKAGSFSCVPVVPVLPTDNGNSGNIGNQGGSGGGNGGNNSMSVVSIACGGNHNLVITANNDVYTWGYGDMLALGHGFEQDEPLPKRINFSKAKIGGSINVTQVAGGGQHSAMIGSVLTV